MTPSSKPHEEKVAYRASGQLPDYERPPVVEVILGVQFERLAGFKNAHLGLFWKTLGTEEWPVVSDAPMLEPQVEDFTESAQWSKIALRLKLREDQSSRLQIKNKNGDRMIQVQNGQIHFNWRGEAGGQYPRYERVREGFVSTMRQFMEFLKQEKLGEFRPNQWEVTYLNHIPKGTVWNTPSDWGFFRPLGDVPTIEGLVHGETFSGGWHFVIPGQRGRLHVQWQHGMRSQPAELEVIVLTLTARGPIAESDDTVQVALDGVNLGHVTIVRSFAAFMTKAANDCWGLKDGSD